MYSFTIDLPDLKQLSKPDQARLIRCLNFLGRDNGDVIKPGLYNLRSKRNRYDILVKHKIIRYAPIKKPDVIRYAIVSNAVFAEGGIGRLYQVKAVISVADKQITCRSRRNYKPLLMKEAIKSYFKRFVHEEYIRTPQRFKFKTPVSDTLGFHYQIMPRLNGVSLDKHLVLMRMQPPNFCNRLVLARNMISAVHEQVHESDNMLHLDLKPANMMVHNNEISIIDYGFAQSRAKPQITEWATPLYQAPECRAFPRVLPNEKIEIYALGIALGEIFNCNPLNSRAVGQTFEGIWSAIEQGMHPLCAQAIQALCFNMTHPKASERLELPQVINFIDEILVLEQQSSQAELAVPSKELNDLIVTQLKPLTNVLVETRLWVDQITSLLGPAIRPTSSFTQLVEHLSNFEQKYLDNNNKDFYYLSRVERSIDFKNDKMFAADLIVLQQLYQELMNSSFNTYDELLHNLRFELPGHRFSDSPHFFKRLSTLSSEAKTVSLGNESTDTISENSVSLKSIRFS